MTQALVVFVALMVGMFMGMFFAGSCRNTEGVDGHVRIGDTWHEVDCHGRVIFRAEDKE